MAGANRKKAPGPRILGKIFFADEEIPIDREK